LIKDYERHGTTKDHLVIVGDSIYSDYPLALQVKIDFIGVTWGHSAKEDFIRAGLKEKYILDSMTELLPLIEQWQDS